MCQSIFTGVLGLFGNALAVGREGEEFAGMAFVRRHQRLSLFQTGPVLASSKLDPCDGDSGSGITHSKEGKFCMQQQAEGRSENM